MSSLVEMDLFDDPNEGAAFESHAMSDDDLPSEDDDDDDDDDDDELNTADMAHVRWYFLFELMNTFERLSTQGSMDIKKPLAGMLPNTYEGKTAEELFPAFKPNAVRRWRESSSRDQFLRRLDPPIQ